jgi:hypothetical protein
MFHISWHKNVANIDNKILTAEGTLSGLDLIYINSQTPTMIANTKPAMRIKYIPATLLRDKLFFFDSWNVIIYLGINKE